MASSTTELIKERIDIVEFLKGYLQLRPAGKNFKANCPFHREKTPSFMVSPERQTWHCFGCNLGGDIFGFLMRYENLEFGEALRVLAEKAGVELKQLNPTEYKTSGLLYDLNNAAKEYFKKSLASAAVSRSYLKDRKLSETTIEEFELGWAPQESEGLCLHFLNLGFSPQDIMKAGLAIKTERGLLLDRFRGRIMFPIHNHFGKVVGFTGRILPQLDTGEMGKYVNSPETVIFNKSKLLYGLWRSKNAVRESRSVFLVEGQMDFLMSWQAGVKNVVASSGTALTADHLRVLRRLADDMILSFDNDDAGREAGERAIDLAEASDFQVKVVTFSGDFKDPADVVANDEAALPKAIQTAIPAPQFYFEKYLPDGFDPSKRDDLKRIRAILMKIKLMTSPIEQNFWMQKLGEYTGLEERVIRDEFEKLEVAKPLFAKDPDALEIKERKPMTRRELIGERLLSAVAATNDPAIMSDSVEYLAAHHKDAFELLQRGEKFADDPELDAFLNLINLKSEDLKRGELEELKRQLFQEYVKERKQHITLAIKKAEAKGDAEALKAAIEDLQSLPSIPQS